MSGGAYGGRSPPRPHLFGGLNFPVVSEEGNTSILRSNADQEFLFGEFCEVLVLTPGESVQGIEIKEMRGDGNE